MSSPMTMFKLETMIYASEDGTSSVFTLNPALQKQLDALAAQHPEVCCRKAKATAYTIRLRQPIDSTLANYSWTVAQNAAVLLHK